MLQRVYRAGRASIAWVGALDRASKGRYVEALERLDTMERYTILLACEYHLLKAFLYQATGESRSALDHLGIMKEELSKARRYNNDEKKYLLCYASVIEKKIGNERDLDEYPDISEKRGTIIDFRSIDLSKVSESIKKNFPFREQPD